MSRKYCTLIDSDLLNKDSGIKNAGTFHIICKSCDSKIFQDYENPSAYESAPTQAALNQIALKTSLRDIYKHETEIELYEATKQIMKSKAPHLSFFINMIINLQIKSRKRDIQECYEIFDVSKAYLSSPKSWLKIISYDKLDFTSPIAFQGKIALTTGVNGEIIKSLEETAKILQDSITSNPKKSIQNAVKDYDLRRDTGIPNLFSKDYAIIFDE